jgi:putative transposase
MDAVLHEDDYLATSDGEKLPSLKSFRKSQGKLAKISQRKSRRRKGSAMRLKLALREARQHQKIARARALHAYKTAHVLMRTGKRVFVHEDLNLKGLTKRNKAKKDEEGKYLPNGQSAKSGLNKSWLDAAFGNFFTTLKHIAAKAGVRVIAVNPSYTSQYLCYRDEKVFINCEEREYWDEVEKINVDRDINAAINIKRVGLELFLTINRRGGKISKSFTNSTAKQILETLKLCQKPTLTRS